MPRLQIEALRVNSRIATCRGATPSVVAPDPCPPGTAEFHENLLCPFYASPAALRLAQNSSPLPRQKPSDIHHLEAIAGLIRKTAARANKDCGRNHTAKNNFSQDGL